MKQFCQSCGLLNKNENTCRLYNKKVSPSTDFCSRYTKDVVHCELCNNITMKPTYVPDGDNWHSFCTKCADTLSSCNFCKDGRLCEFESNPDPMPKVVVQQQRTPMGIMQSQVRNPAREEKFCYTCRCWSTDLKACGKQFGYCERINHIYEQPSWLKPKEENEDGDL